MFSGLRWIPQESKPGVRIGEARVGAVNLDVEMDETEMGWERQVI